jgi:glycosyltransferase involved in cell wall biosynthesis
MKFTIYTSFYNYLDSADDLCNAIINQTHTNWEWLIIDDFSEDLQVFEKLKELKSKDKRIKLIKPNWKKQYYYNIPVEHSSGDVILKIDSDDIPSPKLLEVYKYNYEKFPDVISIGTSSLIKDETHTGVTSGYKYINYGKSSNYLESRDNSVKSIIGDARSYMIKSLKNRGVFVTEEDLKYTMGEDVHKSIIIEEWGKFFSIPRILHHYTMRDSSNSGGKSMMQLDRESHDNFFNSLIDESKLRVNRDSLISIEKYYDSSFNHLKNFYFADLHSETKTSNIEYWSDNLFAEDILKINEMYFDHKLFYNTIIENPDHIIVDLTNDINFLDKVITERNFKNSNLIITTLNENRSLVSEKIKHMGVHFINVFLYTTFKFKF